MLNKLHIKRNAKDRFALCGIWPDHSFILLTELSHQPVGAACQTCISAATANPGRQDSANGSLDVGAVPSSGILSEAREANAMKIDRRQIDQALVDLIRKQTLSKSEAIAKRKP
jgi:hypothetical protein